MPSKNTVKLYVEDGYYHVYNRGVESRTVFLDDNDYRMFLYFLKYYLEEPQPDDIKQLKRSLRTKVSLLCYCLMPNHYHLLLKQFTRDGMTRLIRAVSTNYACYFNSRYQRVGSLFQGIYKAALVDSDPYILHVSRYIHLNPSELNRVGTWEGSDPLYNYPYSSYAYYLGNKHATWLNTDILIAYFHSANNLHKKDYFSYESFVEGYPEDLKELLENIALD